MRTVRSLFSLTPQVLLSETRSLLAARAVNLAELLEHLAEIDARKLYVEAAYGSTTAFLVGELGMDPDSADKKIQAARAVRRVPALLSAIADGRLHLSAALMLLPSIDVENAEELIAAAANHSCGEIRVMLAERARARGPQVGGDLLSQVVANTESEPDSNPVISRNGQAVAAVQATAAQPTAATPARRTITFTIPAELADAYRAALALAPYAIAHDPARAFEQMVAAWREQLEKRKFGTGRRSPRPAAASKGPSPRENASAPRRRRYIPKHVRREVWHRDGGQCTFESDAGRRCERRSQLEYDHVIPEALGGDDSAKNLRLRCCAHNQLAAERAFGKRYIEGRREVARAERASRRAERDRTEAVRAEALAARDQARAEREHAAVAEAARRAAADEVVPYLRQLGLRASEAKAVALKTALAPDVPLEARVLAAVRTLGPRGMRVESRDAAPPA